MRARFAVSIVVLALSAMQPGDAHAQEAELSEYVAGAIEFYNERARDPLPRLTSKQMAKVVDGDHVVIVRRETREREEGADVRDRVVGYAVLDFPRRNVWLTALDPDAEYPDIYRFARLANDGRGGSTWYTHLDLPWPVADRHWMVDISKGLEVEQASGGLMWEHRWDLATDGEQRAREFVASGRLDGLSPEDLDKSVYLPVNYGGLVAVELDPERTLLVYHLTTDVGGHIPDGLVTTFARAQVGLFLGKLRKSSAAIFDHYVDGHEPVYDGAGQPIPTASGR